MRSRWAGIVLIVTMMAALAVLVLSGRLAVVANFTRWLVAPAEAALSREARSLRHQVEGPHDIQTLRAENERLRREINRLQVAQVRLAEVEKENQRLRALLNFAQNHPDLEVRGAGVVGIVIGEDPATVIDRLLLNVGEVDGIHPGMPVVTDTGLVGRIVDVHKTTSVVLPLTAAESAVNAIVQSSRLTGIVRGRHSDTLIMDYIPLDTPVEVGDLVLTSGLGSIFPPRIVIGQVVSVERHDYDVFQRAIIRPTVDFRRLEDVLVLTGFSPNPEVKDVLDTLQQEEGAP